jgi:hypothetical protein
VRRVTLIILIGLFVLLVLGAIFQGPALRQLRRHSKPTPTPTPTATPTASGPAYP